jgi:hypothetical protein
MFHVKHRSIDELGAHYLPNTLYFRVAVSVERRLVRCDGKDTHNVIHSYCVIIVLFHVKHRHAGWLSL